MSLVIGLTWLFSIVDKVHRELLMGQEEEVSVGAVGIEGVAGLTRIEEVGAEDEVDGMDSMGTETVTETVTEMIADLLEVLVVIEIGTTTVVDDGSWNISHVDISKSIQCCDILYLFCSNGDLFAVYPVSTFSTSFLYDFHIVDSHAFVHTLTHVVHT
jgi:hypothetical protein